MSTPNLLRLVFLAALWGASFLFMRVVSPVLGAVPSAFGRVGLGALGLLVLLLVMRVPPAFRGRLPAVLLIGTLSSGIPFLMYSLAALVLPAGYSAIINALTPLMGVMIGAAFFGEAISRAKLAGVVLGLAGVAVLTQTGPVVLDAAVLGGVLACLTATVCYGFSSFLTRRWITERGGLDNRLVAFGTQVGAVLCLAPLLAWQWITSPEGPALHALDATGWGALLALGLLCTAFAYVVFFGLMAEVGPVKALSVTFLVPLFGVLWGWVFLDEALSLAHAAGGGLIAVALWLVIKPSRLPTPPRSA